MNPKIVTISQQKGGAGKTTIAVHLGIALAKRGLRVAFYDLDPQESLTDWFATREEYVKEDSNPVSLCTHTSHWRIWGDLDSLCENHDIVIVDCPPHTKGETKAAVEQADLVIVPLQPSPTDLWASTSTLELTLQENANTYVLINRIIHNSRIAQEFLHDLPAARVIATFGNRVGFASSMAEGRTVTEIDPDSKATAEVNALAENVLNILASTESVEEIKEAVKKTTKKPGKAKPAKKAAQKAPAAAESEENLSPLDQYAATD